MNVTKKNSPKRGVPYHSFKTLVLYEHSAVYVVDEILVYVVLSVG